MHIAQQRWRIVETARRQRNLRLPAGCAVGHSLIDQLADSLELHFRDDGSDVDRFVERRTDAQGAHAILNFRNKRLGNALLHQQARARATYLPLIEPDSIDQAFHRAVEVSVFKDDEWRFSAEFK